MSNGFSMIVDGIQLERTDGVGIEGSHEHEQRRLILFKLGRNLQARQPRHLDVEKCHIGRGAADGRGGKRSHPRVGRRLDVALLTEPECQLRTRRPFILRDERPDHEWADRAG